VPLRLAALATVALAGCSGGSDKPGTKADGGTSRPLTLAAASDLQAALPALVAEYRRLVPGPKIETMFGASAALARQVREGAPFDLFLSANTRFVDELASAGLVDKESVRRYAVGSLALAVNRASGVPVEGLDDLKRPEVKHVAIANPVTAPYGTAAKQALTRAGLWDQLEAKVVVAESVRQALQYVQTGNAESGLVGLSTAAGGEVRLVDVDRSLYDPIVQALGVVSASPRKAEAEDFAAFVLGPKGQALLKSHGFRAPEGPEPARPGAPGP
jgi:molybdate transport system substrate-binding protein